MHTQVYTPQGIVITFCYVLEILAASSQIQKGINIKDENNNSGLSSEGTSSGCFILFYL